MKSSETGSHTGATNENSFTPMTEAQMNAVKGGTSWLWPGWLTDLVDTTVDRIDELIEHIDDVLDAPPNSHEDDIFEILHEQLVQDGFELPEWDEIDPFSGDLP